MWWLDSHEICLGCLWWLDSHKTCNLREVWWLDSPPSLRLPSLRPPSRLPSLPSLHRLLPLPEPGKGGGKGVGGKEEGKSGNGGGQEKRDSGNVGEKGKGGKKEGSTAEEEGSKKKVSLEGKGKGKEGEKRAKLGGSPASSTGSGSMAGKLQDFNPSQGGLQSKGYREMLRQLHHQKAPEMAWNEFQDRLGMAASERMELGWLKEAG